MDAHKMMQIVIALSSKLVRGSWRPIVELLQRIWIVLFVFDICSERFDYFRIAFCTASSFGSTKLGCRSDGERVVACFMVAEGSAAQAAGGFSGGSVDNFNVVLHDKFSFLLKHVSFD
jgi:hypothetical protein